MHVCDNPACVCPYHLVCGTHKDNVQDCVKKGRSKHFKENGFFGQKHKMAKLTDEDVLAIRKIDRSQSLEEISNRFGVSKATVCNILKRKSWKHL